MRAALRLCAGAALWVLAAGPLRAQDSEFFLQRTPSPPAAPAATPGEAPEEGQPPAAPEDPEAARQGELRLRLLQAQLHILTGRFSAARDAYQALQADMPASAEPAAGLGAVARDTGRARLAREHYREAVRIDPDNRPAAEALAALERDRAPRLRTDVEQRFQRDGIGASRADITIGEVGGYWNFGEAWRVGAIQGIAYVDARSVQRASGAVGDFSGTRVRTEAYATHEWRQGETLTASVYANEWSAGLGLLGRVPDDWGSTALRAEYRRPVWDFVEAIIDGAVRDRVALERFQRFTTRLTLRLEGAVNRYGIPRDGDDLVRTATVRGELRLDRIGGIAGLSLSYALDAEYVLDDKTQYSAAGNAFRPLPIVDREVHAGLIGYGGSLGSVTGEGRFAWQLTAGYGADRYGRSGPLAYATIGYAFGALEAALRGGYVRNIGRSQGETTVVGATLTWRF